MIGTCVEVFCERFVLMRSHTIIVQAYHMNVMSVIKSNFSNLQLHGTRIGTYTICCGSMYFIGRMAFSIVREI